MFLAPSKLVTRLVILGSTTSLSFLDNGLSRPALYAASYLSIEQAQTAIFGPGYRFDPQVFELNETQAERIASEANVRVRDRKIKLWKVSLQGKRAGFFIVDNVLGKHEFITFAIGLTSTGKVQGLEILEYRETHGGQVRGESWRRNFLDKSIQDPVQLGKDIPNISGATLSCRHLADGVRRLLTTSKITDLFGSNT